MPRLSSSASSINSAGIVSISATTAISVGQNHVIQLKILACGSLGLFAHLPELRFLTQLAHFWRCRGTHMVSKDYCPQDFEEKWQGQWEEAGIYQAVDGD